MKASILPAGMSEPTTEDLLRFLTAGNLDNEAISRLATLAARLSPQYRARLIERFSSLIGAISETMA
jgi:hypothetical protein